VGLRFVLVAAWFCLESAGDALGWQHLCLTPAQSYPEWQLTHAKAGDTPDAPAWHSERHGYRARVNDGQLAAGENGGCRRWADFTALIGRREHAVPVPDSAVVVACVPGPAGLVQHECPTSFLPDARYDALKEAVGTLVWQIEGGRAAGIKSWWVYFNTGTNAAGSRPGQTAGSGVGAVGDVRGRLAVPLYNYQRGTTIPCRITLENLTNTSLAGRVTVALMDQQVPVQRYVFDVVLEGNSRNGVECPVETKALASKAYTLDCRLNSGTVVHWAASAALEVVSERKPGLLVGLYGLPRDTRMRAIRSLEDARRHNLTLDNGHYNAPNNAFYFDMAAAYGVNLAPCAHEDLWPYGLPKGAVRQQVESGAASDWPCFRDPVTREWARRNLLNVLTNLAQYPAFCDRIGFHDDVTLRTVTVGKEAALTCYCPLCREEFKRQTGLEAPSRTATKWPDSVVEDNDPWLRWNTFRVRDCYADFTRSLTDVIAQAAPQVKLGSFVVKNLNPVAGLYAYYHQAPCGAASCYDYPRATGADANAFFMRQSAIMGNRQKESWMLNWIGGDPSLAMGTDTASPGEVRCQFWNMLAAGNQVISFFRYGEPGTKECIEGTAALEELGRVGGLAKQVGPLFVAARPAPAKVAVLCSFTDYCGSLLRDMSDWWNVRAALRTAFFAALEGNLSPAMVAEEELAAGQADDYRVIIVPNIRFLRRSAVEALEQRAARGTRVLVNANSSVRIQGAVRCLTSQEMAHLAREAVGRLPLDPRSSHVTVQDFVAPGLTLHVLVNQVADGDRVRSRYARAETVALTAGVHDGSAAYYDLLAGKALAVADDKIGINLPAAGGSIIAAYDQPVGAMEIGLKTSVARGEAQTISLKVKTRTGAPSDGTHLLDVVVSNADGISGEYSQRLVAVSGTATASVPVAINDPPGSWKVRVREVASSIGAEASFQVLAHRGSGSN
jgi:hypothetical protein